MSALITLSLSVFDSLGFVLCFVRSMHQNKPIGDAKFQVPVFVVMGEKDYVYKFPGVESAMKDGTMERHAPDMKITYIPEGSHFVQEQFPDYVNELLLAFLKDHPVDK